MSTRAQIILIAGHFGSGKTEFAVNYALALAAQGKKVRICDLDIVNPYFRSAERKQLLETAGIELIASSSGGLADVPALPPELAKIFGADGYINIVDLGGDPQGAKVLGYYKPQLAKSAVECYFVLNKNRPETATLPKALAYFENIQYFAGQKFTAIINNTHLCQETTLADVQAGAALARDLAATVNLPLLFSVVPLHIMAEAEQSSEQNLFPIAILMRKPWEVD